MNARPASECLKQEPFSSFNADLAVPLHALGESNLAAAAAEASPLCRATRVRNLPRSQILYDDCEVFVIFQVILYVI